LAFMHNRGPLQFGYSVWRRASIDWNRVWGDGARVRGILMKWLA
jgi:hypothetical protein